VSRTIKVWRCPGTSMGRAVPATRHRLVTASVTGGRDGFWSVVSGPWLETLCGPLRAGHTAGTVRPQVVERQGLGDRTPDTQSAVPASTRTGTEVRRNARS
jgi:hypothetical protein